MTSRNGLADTIRGRLPDLDAELAAAEADVAAKLAAYEKALMERERVRNIRQHLRESVKLIDQGGPDDDVVVAAPPGRPDA